ncbi:MAG: hypothetical protein AB7T49_19520 [Oligoflexales bacterium]
MRRTVGAAALFSIVLSFSGCKTAGSGMSESSSIPSTPGDYFESYGLSQSGELYGVRDGRECFLKDGVLMILRPVNPEDAAGVYFIHSLGNSLYSHSKAQYSGCPTSTETNRNFHYLRNRMTDVIANPCFGKEGSPFAEYSLFAMEKTGSVMKIRHQDSKDWQRNPKYRPGVDPLEDMMLTYQSLDEFITKEKVCE